MVLAETFPRVLQEVFQSFDHWKVPTSIAYHTKFYLRSRSVLSWNCPMSKKLKISSLSAKFYLKLSEKLQTKYLNVFNLKNLEVLGVFILKMKPTARLFWLENVADRKNVILGVFLQKSAWNFYRSWKRWYFIEWVKKTCRKLAFKGPKWATYLGDSSLSFLLSCLLFCDLALGKTK